MIAFDRAKFLRNNNKRAKEKENERNFSDEWRSYWGKNILLKGRNDEKMLYRRKGSGLAGRKFHENEKRESFLFLVVRVVLWSDTVDLHSLPAIFSLPPVALSFSFSRIPRRSLIPVSLLLHILAPICRAATSVLRCLWRTRRASRAFQIPLGTTGSAVAMPLPAENRYMEEGRDDGNKRGTTRGWGGGQGGREKILQRKAIAAKSFSSRGRHVHVVGVFSAPYPAYKTYSRWHSWEMRHETRCMSQKQDTFYERLGFHFSINWTLLFSVHATIDPSCDLSAYPYTLTRSSF